MKSSNHSTTALQGVFNTLAQIGTNKFDNGAIIIKGNGSDLSNKEVLKGRAKRKLITQKTVLSLIDVVEKNGNDERKKGYWNTYHCQNKVYTVNEKLFAKYCKNRFCTLCCSIRKAELINKYFPIIQQWQEPYFVTLTIKAFPLHIVGKAMIKILKCFNLIVDKYKKRHQRGKGIKLIGIRALESNFNPKKKTYNPHLHLIVANKEMADIIVAEWQERFTTKYVSHKGQKAKPIDNTEIALIEIIKYGSKIFTEPDVNKKQKSTGNEQIYVAALDNIFKAMKGLRIFERFGFNQPKENHKEPTNSKVVKQYNEWLYDPKQFDWINSHNDKRLTDYKPEPQLLNLLETRINIDLE